MTTNMPVVVLQSTKPDEIEAWKADQDALVATFEKNVGEFQTELDAAQIHYITTSHGMRIRGWDAKDSRAPIPAGWRQERDSPRALVPARKTPEGKAHAARMDKTAVNLPPAPGLPSLVWGEGFMGSFRVEEQNGRWYACLGFELKRDQSLVMAGVDLDIWFQAPLSRYHADREAKETFMANLARSRAKAEATV